MDLSARIEAFSRLGQTLHEFVQHYPGRQHTLDPRHQWLEEKVHQAPDKNPWFTIEHILEALGTIGAYLTKENLNQWTARYPDFPKQPSAPGTIGVVPAGCGAERR